MVPQAGQCACCATEGGAPRCTCGDEGNLQRREHRQGASGDQSLRTRLPREVSEGGREDHRRHGRAARVLQVSGRALGASTHDKSHRVYFRDVRLRTKVTKGPGSRAAGLAMAYKLIDAA
ncbi:putative transposase (plasmid) [Rhodococcus opacus B4]|uniref:Putative transposase n=1 Tax=Rhodococcus opacus (strain B4) TaxID=632772 RepID=C1BDP8_RHOOB|nr:putative transposase [Rhodococcus opacus B4]